MCIYFDFFFFLCFVQVSKLKNILKDKDEGHGTLDREEFHEALNEVDKNINHQDIEDIFDALHDKKSGEISIKHFIKFIRTKMSKQTHMQSTITSPTAQTVLRGAFPDIFGDINDPSNRELWGDNDVWFYIFIFFLIRVTWY